jgi:uncharacterized membrane protein YbhN (UPF0104 family)
MQGKPRRWWPVVKALVSLAILYFIGRVFVRDLSRPELWEEPLRVGWLAPAALLYLAGLALCALYWRRLLQHLGQRPPLIDSLRAYYVGQLGKYVPGKALALLLRAGLMRRSGVSAGLAGMTALYEVLVTMAAGAVMAAILFLALTGFAPGIPDTASWQQLWNALREKDMQTPTTHPGTLVVLAVALSALLLTPVQPSVFNRLANRLSLPFRDRSVELPPIRVAYLLEGLLLTALTWPLFGLALALALQAVPGAGLPWDLPALLYVAAAMALAYVAGFVILIAPGALGVREVFLTLLLTPELLTRGELTPAAARGKVLLSVLLLRLSWTTAELFLAAVLYAMPSKMCKEGQLFLAAPDPARSS